MAQVEAARLLLQIADARAPERSAEGARGPGID